MLDRVLIAVAVCAWLAMATITIAAYPSLPDRVPVHFDLRGRPDGFAARSPWSVGSPPGVAFAVGALLLAVRALPGLARYGARPVSEFPESVRENLVRHHRTFLAALVAVLQSMLLAIQAGCLRVALGHATEFGVLTLCASLVAIGAVLAWGVLAAKRVTAAR